MSDKARILLDGEFYLRCDASDVDSVIDDLELSGVCIDDVEWNDDALGRTTVRLTTAPDSECDAD